MNYIDYCVSSMAQTGNMSAIGNNTMTTMNTTLNIDMQADLHKQKYITRLLKLLVQQFSFQYETVGSCCIEYTYQRMKGYFTSSQYVSSTITVLSSLMDLTQYAMQSV